jgi:hypothetical protein
MCGGGEQDLLFERFPGDGQFINFYSFRSGYSAGWVFDRPQKRQPVASLKSDLWHSVRMSRFI